jgi:transcriptional regulator of acetoin/glycerol metabolism
MNNINKSNTGLPPVWACLPSSADVLEQRQLPDWLVDVGVNPTEGDKRMPVSASDSHRLGEPAPVLVGAAEPQDLIHASWLRSRKAGLTPEMSPEFSGSSSSNVRHLLEESNQLGTLAYPVLQALYEQIANTHSMVVLTDGAGRILHSMGDDSFLERAEKVALKPGVDWSETAKGTNAIGTAIELKRPVSVHAEQHYLHAYQFLTCSSTPIFSPVGKVIGVLDVTGDARGYHRHTMALTRMSAQIIENQIFSHAYQHAIRIHFHSRPEFISTLFEGMIAFSRGGRFLAANRGALFQVGLDLAHLERQTLSSLFGLPVDELIDHCRSSNPGLLSLSLPNGVTVRAKAEIQGHVLWTVAGLNTPSKEPSPHATAESQKAGADAGQWGRDQRERMSSLHYLNTGDPQIAKVIEKLRRLQGRDIPILIMGETGVGKELLAKAIHNDSARAPHPFVAVNCASIPENLIESELFGYEEGAFTGARRKGAIGKIQLANGGTLFLDEIGDMPLALQARLLRALQERVITPLGSNRNITVNVAVISATHRNLRQMVAQGLFREDLYYRLNGLATRLPALRERTDLDAVVRHVLLASCENGVKRQLSPAVADMFRRYNWPGNVRQLTNVLRTACVLAGDDAWIDVEHLPDDFVEEVAELIAASAPVCMHTSATVLSASSAQAMSSAVVSSMLPFAAYPISPTSPMSIPMDMADPGVSTATPPVPAWTPKGLQEVELQTIQSALTQCGGNVSAAARLLGVSRNTIYRKVPELAHKPE